MSLCPAFIAGALIGLYSGRRSGFFRSFGSALLCGIQFAAAALLFGPGPYCARMQILYLLLHFAVLSDLDSREIPDRIPAAIGICRLCFSFGAGQGGSLLRGITGMLLIGSGLLILTLCADRLAGRETLGGGDIKLMAMLGLHFGPLIGTLAVILTCVFGLAFSAAGREEPGSAVPLAPAISLAAFGASVLGPDLLKYTLQLA